MDTELTQRESTFNKALETTPIEIRDFLFSEAYTKLINAVAKQFTLSEEKKVVLDDVVFETIIGNINGEDAQEKLASLGLAEEDGSKLLAYIDYYFLTPSIEEISENTNENQKENSGASLLNSQMAPSPLEALTMIKDRLSKPNTITPTKRDYSNELVAEPTTSEAPTNIKSIDPYRELPSE
jgi:hypothetical protein